MKLFKNRELAKTYLIFLAVFYLVWTLKELVLHPFVNQYIPDGSVLQQLLFSGILKNLCWTLPALLLIRKYNQDLYIPEPDLFRNPVNIKQVAGIVALVILYCLGNSLIYHHGFYFVSENLKECVSFIFVGITEEFVFRGFLLNVTLTEKNKPFAIAVNSILFLCIHFPIWILYGNFIPYFANFSFIGIILLSIFFSWSFLKFKSIWVPVCLHMVWDIAVTLLN